MVDFVLSEEQLMLQELAREFALKEIKPNAEKWDEKGEFPKEAISKVLGTGMRLGVRFRDILILTDLKTGQPLVKLRGHSKQHASRKGINRILISISDEKDYALAFAIGISS